MSFIFFFSGISTIFKHIRGIISAMSNQTISSENLYPSFTSRLCLFLLSAATLAFEINLTRLFSVAQFYHFAFMIVSLALLGFGASGTFLSLFPKRRYKFTQYILSHLSLATSLSILGSYLLINWLPFDSFSITCDWRQVAILALHYIALATPFFFSGLTVGLMLAAFPQSVGHTYAINLIGSAFGCLLALVSPTALGGEGIVVLCSGLASLAAITVHPYKEKKLSSIFQRFYIYLFASLIVTLSLIDFSLRISKRPSFSFLDLQLSPYKSLSYAMQYPGSEVISQRWNAFSRVDVVSSPGVRSLPGLSYRFPLIPPPEHGLLVDGDDPNPIVLPGADMSFTGYMPAAIAFQLRPQANALILGSRGGLDILIALSEGAHQVTAVEANRLIVEEAAYIYNDPQVKVVLEPDRSFLRRGQDTFDIAVFSLTSAYHPISSGAYSLGEDYRYTVESFQDALTRLNPDGLLVITRWLQIPPSEYLRSYTIAVTALEQLGLKPTEQIIAFRSYNIGLLLIKPTPFTQKEANIVRTFAAERSFDMVFAPDIQSGEINQYNILAEPLYYQAFHELLTTDPRTHWYESYPFDVTPSTDDHPFFGHFFRWSQAGQVVAQLGKIWQPFGGAGYFVLLALLFLVAVIAAILILLPVIVGYWRFTPDNKHPGSSPDLALANLGYFGLIGLAFMLVEIPLTQHFILFLGYPSYALAAVLFSLLLFSGLGSHLAHHFQHRIIMVVMVVILLCIPWLLPLLFNLTLGFALPIRLIVTTVALAPLGFLMGIPFPSGVRKLEIISPDLVPWVWGVNGAASVVSSVIAALLALSFGFRWVFIVGASCYTGALLLVPYLTSHRT